MCKEQKIGTKSHICLKVQKHMFRLKSKSSTADRGVPAQVSFDLIEGPAR